MIRWILFVAMAFTVPVLWFLLVAVGFIPLIGIAFSFFSGLPKLEVFLLAGNGINLVVWGIFLYYVAGVVARKIEKAPAKWRLPIVGVVLLALGVLPFLPIYGVGDCGGGSKNSLNLYQLLFTSHVLI
jgi:hypothetical protein